MAALDKLLKALTALQTGKSVIVREESNIKAKEKISMCQLVGDVMSSPDANNATNFSYLLSYSMEILFEMCDNQDSNIRMIADESLNRIIRVQMQGNVSKVNLGLHKEIKRNRNPRSLRAALWRFGELAHLIRPSKRQPYIQSLIPALMQISQRTEETVLETLAAALPKILLSLGSSMTDSHSKEFINALKKNVCSDNPVLRRSASSCIVTVCLHCSRPQYFVVDTIISLLELVLPVKTDQNSSTVLGVLNSLRGLIPHISDDKKESVLGESFGNKRKHVHAVLSSDAVVQMYELCLDWTHHTDHNVVTAALETLKELLTTLPKGLDTILIDAHGLGRSRIHTTLVVQPAKSLIDLNSLMSFNTEDDSLLLDTDDILPASKVSAWLRNASIPDNQAPSTQPQTQPLHKPTAPSRALDSLSDYPDSESLASEDIGGLFKDEVKPLSPEPEEVFEERDSPSPPPQSNFKMDWEIGSVTEKGIPSIVYCARRLVTAFLVPECTNVRVSHRALALLCLGQVLRVYPQVFTLPVDQRSQQTPLGFSHIYDALRLSNHSDPQLRGICRLVVGNVISSVLNRGHCSFSSWLPKGFQLLGKSFDLQLLVDLLFAGLNDDSAITVRHTLSGVNLCLTAVIESNDFIFSIPILDKLLTLVDNSYWLTKAKLIELLCSLPYSSIFYITGCCDYQDKLLKCVVPALLSCEDSRVRKMTAESLVKLVKNLYFPNEGIIADTGASLGLIVFSNIYKLRKDKDTRYEDVADQNLSRVVELLVRCLSFSTSKLLSHGCIESLSLLSMEFDPAHHRVGWCLNSVAESTDSSVSRNGVLRQIVAILAHSPVSLDLECHQWLLALAGNLFNGLAPDAESSENSSEELCAIAEELLIHVMRILNMFVRITEESMHQPRHSGLSPLHQKVHKSPAHIPTKLLDEENKEDRKRMLGIFTGNRHCLKLFEIIKSGYSNYKLTLDPSGSEKLVNLITQTLLCLKQLLHVTIANHREATEELLSYLSYTFCMDSSSSILVVNQLLKSLFEVKTAPSTKNKKLKTEREGLGLGLHAKLIQTPIQELSEHIEASLRPPPRDDDEEDEVVNNNAVKYAWEELAKKIKLFEGIVIQALKEYTITSNTKLQVEVLALLTQLVNLKVNYCLLDSDQVFIEFVKDQLQYIEAGQIQSANLLVPQIFKFLVHLSNEKNHSKPVINIPQIIQLCDGLMASGQNPVTHCIPAFIPVIDHVFLLTPYNVDNKELQTQREVILAKLFRMAKYPEVLALLNKVMEEGWRWEEHWRPLYLQIVETIWPLLAEGKVVVNDINVLHSLLSPNSRLSVPLNEVIGLLFIHKQDGQTVNQWLALVTTMLLSICKYQEERVLLHLEDSSLYVREEGDDPLKVNNVSKTLPPQHLIAKLILRVIQDAVTTLRSFVENYFEAGQIPSLEKTFATFLVCCIYLLEQGNYEELGKSLSSLLAKDGGLDSVHKHFLVIKHRCPVVVILYADILMLLDIGDTAIWQPLMQNAGGNTTRLCLNLEVVKQSCTMLYCEYLAKKQDLKKLQWILDASARDIINNVSEYPVNKLLSSVDVWERNGELLLKAASQCVDQAEPVFAHRLLKTLEYGRPHFSGSVLNLVALSLVQNKNIAIARLATSFCCRTIECMLVSEKRDLLTKDGIINLLNSLKSNQKHFRKALINTLKKLGEEKHGISWESHGSVSVDVLTYRNLKPDKDWLVEQIKRRCYINADTDGVRCTRLLSTLDEDELETMFLSDNFDKSILQHCFTVRTDFTNALMIENLPTVHRCARRVFMKYIHEICDALPSAYNEIKSGDVDSYELHLHTLLRRLNYTQQLLPLSSAIINYFSLINDLNQSNCDLDVFIPSNSHLDMVRFSLLCLKASISLIEGAPTSGPPPCMSDLQNLVESSCRVLSFHLLASLLKLEEIHIILACVSKLVVYLSGEQTPFNRFRVEKELVLSKPDDVFLKVTTSMATLLSWIENFPRFPSKLPSRMEGSLKALVVSLGRTPKLKFLSKLPVEVWPARLDSDEIPSIPLQLLHDPEIFTQMINRIRLLGWTNRLEFEEMWVSLLCALTLNPDVDNPDQEEVSIIMHANSLVVEGITWLILSTLTLNANNSYPSKLRHIPRSGNHKLYQLQYWNRLEEMNNVLCWKLRTLCKWSSGVSVIDERPNLERIHHYDSYGFGQLSVAFLQAKATASEESPTEGPPQHEKQAVHLGNTIDVRSCLQFILELFSQWMVPYSEMSLNLLLSMVKSIVCLSDMFCELGHHEWMFNHFLNLAKSHPSQDEILHQYLTVGILKSAAVLQIGDGERSDQVIKIVEAALKSSCFSIRSGGVHGVLYLLQSVKSIKKLEGSVEIPKLSPQEFRQRLLALCNEFIEKALSVDNPSSVDCQLLIALCTYVLESFAADIPSPQNIIQAFISLAKNPSNKCIYLTVIYGLERLVLTGSCSLYRDQITRLALDRFSQSDPSISLPALQLLTACIYAGKADSDRQGSESDDISSDTEIMEKTTALFDKIKKGYPIEVEVVCEILPTILSDFFPVLDVPTKVITEFLSPNQPHTKNMANMVFQVFTRACKEKHLPLLQDWVVDSLNSFTSNLSLKTVVWSLCCFFISCSDNPWLRAIFPHWLSRIGHCELEDKEIFCIAAIQFYKQLSDPQREIFISSFKKTATSHLSPFSDVLACLT